MLSFHQTFKYVTIRSLYSRVSVERWRRVTCWYTNYTHIRFTLIGHWILILSLAIAFKLFYFLSVSLTDEILSLVFFTTLMIISLAILLKQNKTKQKSRTDWGLVRSFFFTFFAFFWWFKYCSINEVHEGRIFSPVGSTFFIIWLFNQWTSPRALSSVAEVFLPYHSFNASRNVFSRCTISSEHTFLLNYT